MRTLTPDAREPVGAVRRLAGPPWCRLLLAAAALAAVLGCDSVRPVEWGTLRVMVSTSGVDFNAAGYTVSVDGDTPRPVATNDTLELTGIDVGQHTVALGGPVVNCSVNGAHSAKVNVRAGLSSDVAFTVTCLPLVGVLLVNVVSSGADLDADGYLIVVDGGAGQTVPTAGALLVSAVKAGPHTVGLSGLAPNCTVVGANQQTADVSFSLTAIVTFGVTCSAVTGRLRVVTTTGGASLDPDGYTIAVDGFVVRTIAINQADSIVGLAPGVHTVTLSGEAPNCTIAAPNPRSVTLIAGATDTVAFAVTCTSTDGWIRVTAATTGPDADGNGYQLWLDNNYYYPTYLAANGVTTLTAAAGTHTIELQDVAPNCTVTGTTSRAATVAIGDTVSVAYVVSCTALGSLQVTLPTSGTDLDQDGYDLLISGPGYQQSFPAGANLPVTITGLAANDYTVTVLGVALNCAAAAPNPRTVSVATGAMSSLGVPVTCAPLTRLAFAGNVAGNIDVYAANSDGSGNLRLTSVALGDGDPAWSPDGARIAFTSARDGNNEIYVMNADGSNPVRLTASATPDYRPAWSPDGSRIAFTSERDGNAEIYVMNADGSGVQRLTNNGSRDDGADWSPDGARIAFSSERGGNPGIWVMNADGTGAVRLSSAQDSDAQPAWSPDGTKIAFSRLTGCYYNNCDYDVYVMNANGSGVHPVTSNLGTSDSDPTWSADGRLIAYGAAVCDYYYTGCYPNAIMGIRADGTDPVPVASGVVSNPAWKH